MFGRPAEYNVSVRLEKCGLVHWNMCEIINVYEDMWLCYVFSLGFVRESHFTEKFRLNTKAVTARAHISAAAAFPLFLLQTVCQQLALMRSDDSCWLSLNCCNTICYDSETEDFLNACSSRIVISNCTLYWQLVGLLRFLKGFLWSERRKIILKFCEVSRDWRDELLASFRAVVLINVHDYFSSNW